ncbi:hypothetical protein [Bradyrhizobium sp. Bra64]|uniref:hypothetical protein n=1 Tax=Bradyrhizobium sp. Bra64 TaxID=2926009 RepID=UPI002118FFEA|nr:hypothetical protein [Bradyrhizobium sp. Bra64]
MKWLAGKDFVVPLQITIKAQTMPVTEPLVAKLLAVQWPRAKHDCRILRSQIWDEHGDEIRALMQKRVLSAPLLARLLQTRERAVRAYIHFHYVAEHKAPIRLYKPKPTKVQPTAVDRATIKTIERTDLPSDPAERSRVIFNRVDSHIEHIEDMIARKVLAPRKAADLLNVAREDLRLVRVGRRYGLSADQLLGRTTVSVPDDWWFKVREAHAEWPTDTGIELFCRVVAAGFPGARKTFSMYIWKHLRAKAPSAELTERDRDIINALSNITWSTDTETLRVQRLVMVRRYFLDVDAMVQADKINASRASSLLHVTYQRFRYLSLALAAGLTVDAATAAARPVSAGIWAIVEREHKRTPDEADLPFFVRMKVSHGYVGGEKALRTFRINLRLRASRPLAIASEEVRGASIW